MLMTFPLSADDLEGRDGWSVIPTTKPFDVLVEDTRTAIKENGLIVVTQAGPTKAAANRGITIGIDGNNKF